MSGRESTAIGASWPRSAIRRELLNYGPQSTTWRCARGSRWPFGSHWPRIPSMASKAVDHGLRTRIVRNLRYVVPVDRLHHREHQPRRALLLLVVEVPLPGYVTETATDAE